MSFKDETVTTRVTAAIYDIAADGMVDIDIVESKFQMPDGLTDKAKSLLYATVIGFSYSKLERQEEAIKKYDIKL